MAQNKRILIVDDQQDLREQMAKLLSRSTKKSETVSLVRQMRSRLLGLDAQEQDQDDEPERGGYQVETASQGQEALEKVKRAIEAGKPYAAMFLDMRMPPGWDGLETAKRVREVDKLIEIVIMTAYADHDQETIAKSVGAPEKLLYIKKPFQSEEIFQLALCLTAKWGAEEDERLRKGWLEGLIRGMSRIKGIKSDKPSEVCGGVLKALLTFIPAQKGFIAICGHDGKWRLEHSSGVDQAEANSFINDNAAKFSGSQTAQSVGGKYQLPLKREGFSGMAVIYDANAPNDPEWYKLLNLLVMTASEALASAAAQDELRRMERALAISSASAKIADFCSRRTEKLKDGLSGDAKLAALAELEGFLSNLKAFGSPLPAVEPVKTQLPSLLQDFASELKAKAPAGLSVETQISGLSSAELPCSAKILKDGLLLAAAGRMASAAKAGAKSLLFKVELKAEGQAFRIYIEDDGPAVDAELASLLFDPFAVESEGSFDLIMPAARILLKTAGASICLDPRPAGTLLCVGIQPAHKTQ